MNKSILAAAAMVSLSAKRRRSTSCSTGCRAATMRYYYAKGRATGGIDLLPNPARARLATRRSAPA
jgi:hypothetical protein